MEAQRTAYISTETESDIIKRKNLYLATAFIGFVWMLFHFTVVYFFTLQLKSPVLVGIFLAVGNIVALILDIPVGILVRYFSPKKLYSFGVVSQLVAGCIFLYFIYSADVFGGWNSDGIASLLTDFLSSFLNIALLILAACMYGFTKEINDITTLSYILNNSDPSEYSSIISRNNIYGGVGSLLGLLASGTILAFDPTVAVIMLNIFIIILMVFITRYFDNDTKTLGLSDITKLKVIAEKQNLEKIKEYAVWYVSKADFKILAKEAKLIFLKPISLQSDFNPKIIIPETRKGIVSIRKVLMEVPYKYGLIWLMTMVLAFGFWDTFAASFLIDFLAKLDSGPSLAYAILGCIAIPAFVTQDFFITLAKKIGVLPIVIFGLVLSGISIFFLSMATSVITVLICGICNSLGYAAGMGVSQGEFLDLYNSEFAKKENLTEIDCNASASPMKIVQNFANVLGLVFWGILLGFVGYSWFFIFFGVILIFLGAASIVKKAMIKY